MSTSSTSHHSPAAALARWLAEAPPPITTTWIDRLRDGVTPGPQRRTAPSNPGTRPWRVLMLLCQRIVATGSGVVLKEIVDRPTICGAKYAVIYGDYTQAQAQQLFDQPPVRLDLVRFGTDQSDGLPFPIAGMSNRMPYLSVAFQDLTVQQVEMYLRVWAARIERAIGEFRPHIVHVHHAWLIAALSGLLAPDLPLVVSIHGTDLRRAEDTPHLKALVAPWMPRVREFIALARADAANLKRHFDVLDERVTIFGNGFNAHLFRPDRGFSAELFASYCIPDLAQYRVLLFVGKFDDFKCIDHLIHAFAALASVSGMEDVRLIVGGTGPDAELRRYRDLVARLELDDRVLFLGALAYEHVGQFMNLARVFVLPAFHEPFGLVVLEALASGCRVVSTDQGGPPEFVPSELRARRDVLLVRGLSRLNADAAEVTAFAGALASAMIELLNRPLTVADRHQISRAVHHLTWDSYAERLGTLYGAVGAG